MDESKRHMLRFLEKEIKTYMALDLFLSKKAAEDRMWMGSKEALTSTVFYQQRVDEARKLVKELRAVN